jgi:hypothetical protein
MMPLVVVTIAQVPKGSFLPWEFGLVLSMWMRFCWTGCECFVGKSDGSAVAGDGGTGVPGGSPKVESGTRNAERGTRCGGGFAIMGMGLSPVLEEAAVIGAWGGGVEVCACNDYLQGHTSELDEGSDISDSDSDGNNGLYITIEVVTRMLVTYIKWDKNMYHEDDGLENGMDPPSKSGNDNGNSAGSGSTGNNKKYLTFNGEMFLRLMGVCHTVVVETGEDGNEEDKHLQRNDINLLCMVCYGWHGKPYYYGNHELCWLQ